MKNQKDYTHRGCPQQKQQLNIFSTDLFKTALPLLWGACISFVSMSFDVHSHISSSSYSWLKSTTTIAPNALFPTIFYSYNYDLLPPLAMSNGLQTGNLPSVEWIEMVIERRVELVENNLVAKAKLKREDLSAEAINSARSDAEALLRPLRNQADIVGMVRTIKSILRSHQSLENLGQGIEAYKDTFAIIPLPTGQTKLEDGPFADLMEELLYPTIARNATSLW